MNDVEIIQQRLKLSSESFETFRRKNYNLRRLTAGDLSSFGRGPAASEDGYKKPSWGSADLYDFIIDYMNEGHSNKLLLTVKTLMMQTAYHFPEIDFQDLTPELSNLNSEYCKIRLGEAPKGCNARDHMRMALLDYMIGGIGWVKTCFKNDKPYVLHCDSLDMSWDRSVRLPCDVRWASCRFREPLYKWEEMFPGKFKDDIARGAEPHEVIELEWYYDIDSEEGTFAVFKTDTNEPILVKSNPYYFLENNKKVPYLPYEPMYLMSLPSLSLPIGLVEMMLPNQMAVWDAEENIRQAIERGKPFYEVQEESLTDEQKQAFEDGDIGAIVEIKRNGSPIQARQGISVQADVVRWRDQNNLEIISNGGMNPYVGGSPVNGVAFASEVAAIQGNAGLTAGNIAKDLAAFWERVVKKFLGIGSLYDDAPITIRLYDLELNFDEHEPIKDYLIPDADLVVAEDTMAYRSKPQKIQEAVILLQTAQSLAQLYPQGVAIAYEMFLRANGIKNLQPWLEPQPTQPAQPALPQGAPGAEEEMMRQMLQGQTPPEEVNQAQAQGGMSTGIGNSGLDQAQIQQFLSMLGQAA